ncbi:MAG: hypothetical protein GC154_14560 [bacterium]|nr:hypothetical protein [bacterium]
MNRRIIKRRDALGIIAGGALAVPKWVLGNNGATITIIVRSGGEFSADNPMAFPPPEHELNTYCYTNTGNSVFHEQVNGDYNGIPPHLGRSIKGYRETVNGATTYSYYNFGYQVEFKASFPANDQGQYKISQEKRNTVKYYDNLNNLKTIDQTPANYTDLNAWDDDSTRDGKNNFRRVGNNTIYVADAPGLLSRYWDVPGYFQLPNQPNWNPAQAYQVFKMEKETVLRTYVTPIGVNDHAQRASSNFIQTILKMTLELDENGWSKATYTQTSTESKTVWDAAPF